MQKYSLLLLLSFTLLCIISCGKGEDAKDDKFRDWSTKDKRTVPVAPSFLDEHEKKYKYDPKH